MQYQNRKIFKMLTLSASILAILNPGTSKATDVDWITVGDGFWDESVNWSSNPNLPGQNDDVSIDIGGSDLRATITYRSINSTINSLNSQENLRITSATLNINADSTISADFIQTGGNLGGTNNITVSGLTQLSGGTLGGTGTFFANGGAQLGGASLGGFGGTRVLELHGNSTWDSGFTINNINTLRNSADSILSITGDFNNSGSGTIDNQGILTKVAGSDVNRLSATLNNSGTINVLTGTLSLEGGGTSSGDFFVANGSTLQFGGGTHNLNSVDFGSSSGRLSIRGSARVNTTGNLNFDSDVVLGSGTLNINGPANFSNYAQTSTSSTLEGNATIAVSGLTQLNGGTLGGTGTFFANGGAQLGGASLGGFGGTRVLELHGNSTWDSGFTINNINTLRNSADSILSITGDFNNSGSGTIDNQGILTKVAGLGVTRIDPRLNNSGTTKIESGQLRLSSEFTNQGTVTVSEHAVFHVSNSNFANQGRIEGNGTIQTANAASSLVNSGVLSAGINGTGNLSIIGDYTQTETGFFDIQLGSLTDFDKLNVAGDLNLAGTLRIFSLNDYNPLDGDSFTIATFDDGVADLSDITGVFSNIVWAGFLPGVTFTASYFDHSIVLNASAASSAVPVPGAAWLFGTGLAGLIASKRNRVSVKS